MTWKVIVWEWCNDFYRPDYYSHSPSTNPIGPRDSCDPEEPSTEKHVQRGGSLYAVMNIAFVTKPEAVEQGKPTGPAIILASGV